MGLVVSAPALWGLGEGRGWTGFKQATWPGGGRNVCRSHAEGGGGRGEGVLAAILSAGQG